MSRVWLCTCLLLSSSLALAAASPAELQKKARARMKSLDFEAALPLLEQLRDLPELEGPLRAQALVDLGITFVNLGRPDDARRAFDAALEVNGQVPFPPGVPPKIRRLFDESKEARLARLNPPPTPPVVVPEPAPVKAEPPPARVEIIHLEPTPPPPPPPRRVVLPAVLVAAGVLSLGAGIATAYASQNAGRVLAAGLHTSAQAQTLQTRRTGYATASYACYSAGAALAVVGAALFTFSGPGLGKTEVSGMIAGESGGVLVRGEF